MKITVLGAGPGGYVAAIKAAQLGASVTVIEDTEVGGTCLNRGCVPTKTLIASAEAYSKAKKLDSFGIKLSGEVLPDMRRILERKNKVVSTHVKGIRALFKSWGVVLKEGRGVLQSDREISVRLNDGSFENLVADRIIVATGSRPAEIAALPVDGVRVISSTEALDLPEVPRSLVIVGAGAIGCEFACIYHEFGSEVSIVEMADRAVASEDREVSALLEKELRKKKIRLYTNSAVQRVEVSEGGVRAFLTSGAELSAEKVLVSVGRVFNSDGIGAEAAGISRGPCGEIIVNDRMETNVPGIFAVGDVTGRMLLAHVASNQGLVAAMNCMGLEKTMDYDCVPAAIFTAPEIASVGLRQYQAEEMGMKIRTGQFQFRGLAKAHAIGEISGFVKIIADEATDTVLGAHIIGPHASDLIHEMALAVRNRMKVSDITKTIHAHPTLAEGLIEAAEDVHGGSVHALRK